MEDADLKPGPAGTPVKVGYVHTEQCVALVVGDTCHALTAEVAEEMAKGLTHAAALARKDASEQLD